MKMQTHRNGFAGADLLAAIIAVVLLTGVVIPVVAGGRGDAMIEESMNNLKLLGFAHVLYAAEWDGRQITFAKDDLSAFGDDVGDYNAAHGCVFIEDPGCHPPVLAGWCDGGLWAYWPAQAGAYWVVEPIGFPDGQGVEAFGNCRLLNASQFHQYVNGRFYDAAFYAPADNVALDLAEPLFDDVNEFVCTAEGNPPIWISYVMSPAAMFHPDVMRSNAAGSWQDPWEIDHGHESPGFFEADFPALKTLMIEHHWLQDRPADCNPNADVDFATYDGCEPYYFNHGLESSPVTLFYDLHVRQLPNAEVLAADQQVLKDTGGVDGLWHRGTPFGEGGYFIAQGYDGVPLSHHILTTDGIKGRDTLGEQRPYPINDINWPPPIRAAADPDDIKRQRSLASFVLMAGEENDP